MLAKKDSKCLPLDTLALCDCIELLRSLPDESVDLVVSSPPYNIGKEYESKKALEVYLDEQKDVLRECCRVLKQSGSIFWQVGAYSNKGMLIPLDIRFFPIIESFGMIPRNRIMWVRQHGLHARNKFSCRHESILWFTKSDDYIFDLDNIRVPQKYQNKKAWTGDKKGQLTCNPNGKNPGDIWLFRNVKHNHEEQTIHPCQFPEDMLARIVLSTTNEGGVVFDPYMGTGTSAVVARDHGRHYIGAELDAEYHAVALRRIAGEPDENNCFANLKTLRDYVERTGESIEKFSFDVQRGKKATDRSKSKIFSEQHHLQSLEERLEFEEAAFSADIKGEDRPIDIKLNGKKSKSEAALF
tara:strand:- start:3026 stop:4090 length:1065 start_codon:yes stop_codon:yes gene_type:complete